MTVQTLAPQPLNKFLFELKQFKNIPKKSGCYILSTFDDTILYIGLAKDLSIRYRKHLDDKVKFSPTKDGKAFWFYYLLYDSSNLPKLERTWLNQYENVHGVYPILNKIGSPIS